MVLAVIGGAVAVRWGVFRPVMRGGVLVALWLVVASLAAGDLRAVEQAPFGPFTGVATMRTDPDRAGRTVRAVLQLEGYRYEAQARGMAARALERRLAGEQIVVVGHRRPHDGFRRSWMLSRHVVGRLDVQTVAGAGAGAALTRGANRVHRIVAEVGDHWSPDRGALLSGLMLGNDKALSNDTLMAFRRSGLAHLTAVSGQNVALLLAVVAPLLARTHRLIRWALTVFVVGWFAVLTRFEPSVLRASAMALLGASAVVLGRDRRTYRLLLIAGTALVVVDPFLVRSVSFWLSMSATAGLVVVTPSLMRVFDTAAAREAGRWRRGLATAWATTAGAQVGVLTVSTAVFGLPSSVSLVTNLVAVAPAGFVMTCGPALTAVGAVSPTAARWCAAPLEVLVWWIETVAHVGHRLAPPPLVDGVVWTLVVVMVALGAWRRRRGR
jgi:competence protein ComEC